MNTLYLNKHSNIQFNNIFKIGYKELFIRLLFNPIILRTKKFAQIKKTEKEILVNISQIQRRLII